jgi:tRNA threonylcarbamoyladenosine biosynthesis protein TsaE
MTSASLTVRQVTRSEAETRAVARTLAARLDAGAVVLLTGDLGAGKTAFVRGLAEGLGARPDDVSSPTFTLVQEYRGGRLVLYHADLYRLSAAAADELGLEEVGLRDGVLAVEWPDRLLHTPPDAVRVCLTWVNDTTRDVAIDGGTPGSDGND